MTTKKFHPETGYTIEQIEDKCGTAAHYDRFRHIAITDEAGDRTQYDFLCTGTHYYLWMVDGKNPGDKGGWVYFD